VPTDGAPAATAPADPAAATGADESADGKVFVKFPVAEGTPQAIADAIAEKQPLIIFFFDPDQRVTNDVRAQINTVIEDNTGLVELYSYNLGEFASVDSDGLVQEDAAALEQDSAGQATVALARELGVKFTPHLTVVDSQGYIIFQHSGFLDADMIERQVQRAAE